MGLVFIAPAVMTSTSYVGLKYSAEYTPSLFAWGGHWLNRLIWIGTFYVIYIFWVFMSFWAKRGKMPEWLCVALAIYGGLFMVPVYYSIGYVCIYNINIYLHTYIHVLMHIHTKTRTRHRAAHTSAHPRTAQRRARTQRHTRQHTRGTERGII